MNYLHWDFNDTDMDVRHLNKEFFIAIGAFTIAVCAMLIVGTLL